jgi:hypothetical protein
MKASFSVVDTRLLNGVGGSKGSRCEAAPAAAREAYSLYVERAAAGANEADGPFGAAYGSQAPMRDHRGQ